MPSKSNRFSAIAKEVADRTNDALSQEMASLTTLTDGTVRAFAPTKADKIKLAKLMEIVAEATSVNTRAAKLRDNIEELGEMAIRVLGTTL